MKEITRWQSTVVGQIRNNAEKIKTNQVQVQVLSTKNGSYGILPAEYPLEELVLRFEEVLIREVIR